MFSDEIQSESLQGFCVTADGLVKASVILKPEQNTLILRDIPSTTPSEEIVGIFSSAVCPGSGAPCPTVQSVRADMNDTW